MKTFLLHPTRLLFLLGFLIFLSSCEEEPDLIGMNLQPKSEKLGLAIDTTLSINAYSQIDDSLRTDNYPLCLFGTYNDPIFGTTSASILTQLRLSNNNVSFGSNPTLDSLVLFLPYSGSYMYNNSYEKQYPLVLKIYEVNQKMSLDSLYYSNDLLPYINTELASVTFKPNPKDSVVYNGVKFPPMLVVKFSNDILGKKILNALATNLSDNNAFADFMKGLYIKAMPLSTTQHNKGSILYFNLLSSSLANMTIYYKNNENDSLKYTFVINDNCSKYTYFDHYGYATATADLKNQLGIGGTPDTSIGKQKLFLQAMGGVKVKLKFPTLRDLIKNQKIIVNEAVLILKNADINDYNTPPSLLAMLKKLSSGKTELLPDFIEEGSSFIDATYNSTSREYRIRITRYFQKMLNTTDDDYGLLMFVDSRITSANRFVFYGTDNSLVNRMRLELRYTIIK